MVIPHNLSRGATACGLHLTILYVVAPRLKIVGAFKPWTGIIDPNNQSPPRKKKAGGCPDGQPPARVFTRWSIPGGKGLESQDGITGSRGLFRIQTG